MKFLREWTFRRWSETAIFKELRLLGLLLLLTCGACSLLVSCRPYLSPTPTARQSKIVLAEGGRTRYVILRAADASAVEAKAVNDLAEYLKKISGAVFPILTEVNDSQTPKIMVGRGLAQNRLGAAEIRGLGSEDLLVRACGEDLVLAGGGPRGTAYAVYSFLEQDIGCLWFSPYDEFVPHKSDLAVPSELNRREAPAFKERCLMGEFYSMGVPYEQEGAFLLRNKISQNKGNPEWGEVSRFDMDPTFHSIFYYIVPPDSIDPAKGSYHDPKDVVSIFREHPDWFSMMGGKRVGDSHLCFSNPELREVFTRHFLAAIEKKTSDFMTRVVPDVKKKGGGGGPYTLVFNISRRDVPGLCECERCQALIRREGTPLAPLWDFIVELAKTVKEKHPEVLLSSGLYGSEGAAPATLCFPDNVMLIFCSSGDNLAASFEHPSNSELLKTLQGWVAKVCHVVIWYYPNPYDDTQGLPLGNFSVLQNNFRLFKRLGIEGFYYVENDSWGMMEGHRMVDLQNWLIAKLEWNPEQSLETLITAFTDPYYGPAAPYVREYINQIERATAGMKTPFSSHTLSIKDYTFLTQQFLCEAQRVLDHAEKTVLDNPTLLQRVREVRMDVDRPCLLFWDALAANGWTSRQKDEIAKRYETTCAAAARRRILNQKTRDVVMRDLDLFMRFTVHADDFRLPEEFAGKNARQFIPVAIPPHMRGSKGRVDDPRSIIGRVCTLATALKETDITGQLPLTFGYYDLANKKFAINGQIEKSQIISDGYNFYKMGRAKMSPEGYVWFNSYRLQIPLDSQFDPVHPDREYDFHVSLRFEGPTYLAGHEGKTDAIFVERFVFVPVEK